MELLKKFGKFLIARYGLENTDLGPSAAPVRKPVVPVPAKPPPVLSPTPKAPIPKPIVLVSKSPRSTVSPTPKAATAKPVVLVPETPPLAVPPDPKASLERSNKVGGRDGLSAPPRTVYNRKWEARRLAEQVGRKGGSSAVYATAENEQILVKVFDPEVLMRSGQILRKKLELQLSEAFDKCRKSKSFAWPKIPIFEIDGTWCGYAMARVQGEPLTYFIHPMTQNEHFPGADRKDALKIALGIVHAVMMLHKVGVFVGDFNPDNFLVDPKTFHVTLIDVDGFQVGDVPCLHVRPDFLPPEHLDLASGPPCKTVASDSFSLAVLLFEILMRMRHPYDAVGGGELMANLRTGHFPYGLGGAPPGATGAIPMGRWYDLWSHLPYAAKGAFIQTFAAGATQPDSRTSPAAWLSVLLKYQTELGLNYHEKALMPDGPKSRTHRGRAVPVSLPKE